jgi:hypothetical protein
MDDLLSLAVDQLPNTFFAYRTLHFDVYEYRYFSDHVVKVGYYYKEGLSNDHPHKRLEEMQKICTDPKFEKTRLRSMLSYPIHISTDPQNLQHFPVIPRFGQVPSEIADQQRVLYICYEPETKPISHYCFSDKQSVNGFLATVIEFFKLVQSTQYEGKFLVPSMLTPTCFKISKDGQLWFCGTEYMSQKSTLYDRIGPLINKMRTKTFGFTDSDKKSSSELDASALASFQWNQMIRKAFTGLSGPIVLFDLQWTKGMVLRDDESVLKSEHESGVKNRTLSINLQSLQAKKKIGDKHGVLLATIKKLIPKNKFRTQNDVSPEEKKNSTLKKEKRTQKILRSAIINTSIQKKKNETRYGVIRVNKKESENETVDGEEGIDQESDDLISEDNFVDEQEDTSKELEVPISEETFWSDNITMPDNIFQLPEMTKITNKLVDRISYRLPLNGQTYLVRRHKSHAPTDTDEYFYRTHAQYLKSGSVYGKYAQYIGKYSMKVNANDYSFIDRFETPPEFWFDKDYVFEAKILFSIRKMETPPTLLSPSGSKDPVNPDKMLAYLRQVIGFVSDLKTKANTIPSDFTLYNVSLANKVTSAYVIEVKIYFEPGGQPQTFNLLNRIHQLEVINDFPIREATEDYDISSIHTLFKLMYKPLKQMSATRPNHSQLNQLAAVLSPEFASSFIYKLYSPDSIQPRTTIPGETSKLSKEFEQSIFNMVFLCVCKLLHRSDYMLTEQDKQPIMFHKVEIKHRFDGFRFREVKLSHDLRPFLPTDKTPQEIVCMDPLG